MEQHVLQNSCLYRKIQIECFYPKRKKIAVPRYFIKYANVACMAVHFLGSVIKQTKPTTSLWLRVKKSRIVYLTNKSSLLGSVVQGLQTTKTTSRFYQVIKSSLCCEIEFEPTSFNSKVKRGDHGAAIVTENFT